ncbi:hypothetical protein J6590_015582 [Homalodisca vitripennis]|nr:hypothetical protein J6590_015582 [Homalodisca vitripennis]
MGVARTGGEGTPVVGEHDFALTTDKASLSETVSGSEIKLECPPQRPGEVDRYGWNVLKTRLDPLGANGSQIYCARDKTVLLAFLIKSPPASLTVGISRGEAPAILGNVSLVRPKDGMGGEEWKYHLRLSQGLELSLRHVPEYDSTIKSRIEQNLVDKVMSFFVRSNGRSRTMASHNISFPGHDQSWDSNRPSPTRAYKNEDVMYEQSPCSNHNVTLFSYFSSMEIRSEDTKIRNNLFLQYFKVTEWNEVIHVTRTMTYPIVVCASVMCDYDPRTCDLYSGLASCAVTTPGLDSKQLLDMFEP